MAMVPRSVIGAIILMHLTLALPMAITGLAGSLAGSSSAPGRGTGGVVAAGAMAATVIVAATAIAVATADAVATAVMVIAADTRAESMPMAAHPVAMQVAVVASAVALQVEATQVADSQAEATVVVVVTGKLN